MKGRRRGRPAGKSTGNGAPKPPPTLGFWRRIARRPFARNPRPLVNVVPMTGVIAPAERFRQGLNLASVAPLLSAAFDAPNLEAVALLINSPGGSPVQATHIHDRIRELSAETGVPVIAFTEDVAASGGYMIALAGDEIVSSAASIVGSIGVISAGFGLSGLLEKLGVERRVHTSGTKKAMLDPFRPERAEDVEKLTELQARIHEQFKAMVRARRGDRLMGEENALFTGEIWTGEEARALGLVDGVGELRQTLRTRFGSRLRLRLLARPPRFRFLPFLPGGGERAAGLAAAGPAIAEAIEERLYWARYGL